MGVIKSYVLVKSIVRVDKLFKIGLDELQHRYIVVSIFIIYMGGFHHELCEEIDPTLQIYMCLAAWSSWEVIHS